MFEPVSGHHYFTITDQEILHALSTLYLREQGKLILCVHPSPLLSGAIVSQYGVVSLDTRTELKADLSPTPFFNAAVLRAGADF